MLLNCVSGAAVSLCPSRNSYRGRLKSWGKRRMSTIDKFDTDSCPSCISIPQKNFKVSCVNEQHRNNFKNSDSHTVDKNVFYTYRIAGLFSGGSDVAIFLMLFILSGFTLPWLFSSPSPIFP